MLQINNIEQSLIGVGIDSVIRSLSIYLSQNFTQRIYSRLCSYCEYSFQNCCDILVFEICPNICCCCYYSSCICYHNRQQNINGNDDLNAYHMTSVNDVMMINDDDDSVVI